MLLRSHRGCLYYAPENTVPAFKIAIEKGFNYIETDPNLTKDDKVILHHDTKIYRTVRNPDGTRVAPLDEALPTTEYTYEELLKLDAGIHFSEEFRGTKVPLLEDILALCENTDIIVALDKKVPTEKLDLMFDVIEKYNTKVCFSCKDTERIKKILSRFPEALIDYDGDTTEKDLTEILSLVPYDRLLVWMYLDKPNFAWLTDRAKASAENCARVKKFARLGIANVNNPYDLLEALSYEPYIVEV